MEVICIEDKALYVLIEQVVERLRDKYDVPVQKWIDGETAMQKLHIKSASTLQKLRDEGQIEFTKVNAKTILYNSQSIDAYLERNKRETF